jgi:IMP dehydrogenase
VGIGGGSICSTRLQTGHGVPTLQSVFACYIAKSMAISNPDTAPDNFKPAEIIADGGIRNTGDIVKSLAAGADMAMLGSMLAGTTESPGEMFVNKDGKKYKAYRGMASRDAQMKWRGKTSSLEGISTTIPYKGSVADILSEIDQNIKSGLSYSGARNIQEFRDKCEFIVQTAAGQKESNTHILERR